MSKRKLTGIIVSNKMQKTVVVKVERIKEHPVYKRRYKIHKNYKVHVENSADFNPGEKVTIQETRPISKDKKWEVIEKVSK
jgi:small subunit ribosomal protein S17